MQLYGAIASPYVARVVMFAKIKRLDLPLMEAPGGSKTPSYLGLNPIGKMPTLEVDGQGLGESTIICDYLEDTFPQNPGLPVDPMERARSRLIARIVDLYIAQHVSPLFRQMNPAKRDNDLVAATSKELVKTFGYVEHAMGSGPFAVAGVPTLGDCALSTSTMMLKVIMEVGNFGIEDPTHTGRLGVWWQAMESHPDCQPILAAHAKAFGSFCRMMANR